MWSWIIPIIVEMLVKFVTELLKRWSGSDIASNALTPEKENEFVNSMKWKFWLGPKRYSVARQAFVHARFNATIQKLALGDAESKARTLCSDVAGTIQL
jgi:hypothetical protein